MKKIFLIIGLILGAGAIFLSPLIKEYQAKQKYAFNLDTAKGSINKSQFEGQVLGVFFGYTFCPDVCPTTMSTLSQAISTFPKEKQEKFQALFISVDPKRDKVESLKTYVEYFNPSFIGATSNKKNLDDITTRYKVFYKLIEEKNSSIEYTVSHTAYVFLFDKKGLLVDKISHFAQVEEVIEVLKKYL